MPTTLPGSLLLYASPLVLNGLLFLIWHICKNLSSIYGSMEREIHFFFWMALAALVLNLAAGAWSFTQGYYLPGVVYLAVAGLLITLFATMR